MAKTKFETLIEYILNDDENKARELFHDIVVEKSREIYNNIVSEETEEDIEESMLDEIGMEDGSDGMGSEIEADQEGMSMDAAADDLGDDMGMDHDDGEDHDEEGLEDRVVDLEAALDELKAEFDSLMSDEEGEDHDMGDDMGGDEDEGDDWGSEDEGDDLPEGMVREYVEKAPAPVTSEVAGVNAKSTVAGKNDMGGTTSNIARGGANGNPTGPAKPNNAYAKGASDMGAVDPRTAGKSAFNKKAPAAKTGEVGGTNTSSPLAK